MRTAPATVAASTAPSALWGTVGGLTTPPTQTLCTGAPGQALGTSPTPPTATPPHHLTLISHTGTTSPPSLTTSEL